MRDKRRITRVRDQGGEAVSDPELPLRCAQQQDAAVRGEASAIEICHHLLAANIREGEQERVGRGEGYGQRRNSRIGMG